MEYTFDLNNRAFNAIKNNLKRYTGKKIGKKANEQVNVYLFYSDTCPHCHSADVAINEILSENKNSSVNCYNFYLVFYQLFRILIGKKTLQLEDESHNNEVLKENIKLPNLSNAV